MVYISSTSMHATEGKSVVGLNFKPAADAICIIYLYKACPATKSSKQLRIGIPAWRTCMICPHCPSRQSQLYE